MPLMTLPYNRVLEFTSGHIIRFINSKPTNVPESAVENIIERGGKLVTTSSITGKTDFDDSKEQEEAGKITVIVGAIERLAEEADARNLTGTGEVSVDAVRKAVAPMPMSNALFSKAKLTMPDVNDIRVINPAKEDDGSGGETDNVPYNAENSGE